MIVFFFWSCFFFWFLNSDFYEYSNRIVHIFDFEFDLFFAQMEIQSIKWAILYMILCKLKQLSILFDYIRSDMWPFEFWCLFYFYILLLSLSLLLVVVCVVVVMMFIFSWYQLSSCSSFPIQFVDLLPVYHLHIKYQNMRICYCNLQSNCQQYYGILVILLWYFDCILDFNWDTETFHFVFGILNM